MKTIIKTLLLLMTVMFLAGVTCGLAENVTTNGRPAVGAVLFTLGFPDVDGNGRTCATCHVPTENFQLTPQNVEAPYQGPRQRRLFNPKAGDPPLRPLSR